MYSHGTFSSTIRERLYEYFTFRNTYSYLDVLPKFLKAYNQTDHLTNRIAPAPVTDGEFLAIWRQTKAKRQRIQVATAKFHVGHNVHIIKEKLKFAKSSERNFNSEIYRIFKVIDRRPRAFFELEDQNGTPINGQLYQLELTPIRITSCTIIIKYWTRESNVPFGKYSSAGKVSQDFDTWILTATVKDFYHDIIK